MRLASIEGLLSIVALMASGEAAATPVPYPTSVADLISDYFRDYKHIKQLTLLLCIDVPSAEPQPSPDESVSKYSNFRQIGRHLMVSGNFLIKGDGNIDAQNFSNAESSLVSDMLKCGDFRQGVLLDLRCRHAKFIFQQVRSAPLADAEVKYHIKRQTNSLTRISFARRRLERLRSAPLRAFIKRMNWGREERRREKKNKQTEERRTNHT